MDGAFLWGADSGLRERIEWMVRVHPLNPL
jgi:hypothetical protein